MSAEPDRVSGGTSSDVPYGTLILGGAGVGAVVFGVGSRVAMRLVGKVASPEHLGEQTAFGTVGRVTVNGVVELVVFGSIAGLLCGLIYLAFRSRLPGRWMARGLMFGLFLLVPFGFIITTSSRSDFDLASPNAKLVGTWTYDVLINKAVVAASKPVYDEFAKEVAGSKEIIDRAIALGK